MKSHTTMPARSTGVAMIPAILAVLLFALVHAPPARGAGFEIILTSGATIQSETRPVEKNSRILYTDPDTHTLLALSKSLVTAIRAAESAPKVVKPVPKTAPVKRVSPAARAKVNDLSSFQDALNDLRRRSRLSAAGIDPVLRGATCMDGEVYVEDLYVVSADPKTKKVRIHLELKNPNKKDLEEVILTMRFVDLNRDIGSASVSYEEVYSDQSENETITIEGLMTKNVQISGASLQCYTEHPAGHGHGGHNHATRHMEGTK